MTEYKIITSIYTIPINSPDDPEYPVDRKTTKRVKFNEYVQSFIYSYKPLPIYKSSINYCIRKISKLITLKSIL